MLELPEARSEKRQRCEAQVSHLNSRECLRTLQRSSDANLRKGLLEPPTEESPSGTWGICFSWDAPVNHFQKSVAARHQKYRWHYFSTPGRSHERFGRWQEEEQQKHEQEEEEQQEHGQEEKQQEQEHEQEEEEEKERSRRQKYFIPEKYCQISFEASAEATVAYLSSFLSISTFCGPSLKPAPQLS